MEQIRILLILHRPLVSQRLGIVGYLIHIVWFSVFVFLHYLGDFNCSEQDGHLEQKQASQNAKLY